MAVTAWSARVKAGLGRYNLIPLEGASRRSVYFPTMTMVLIVSNIIAFFPELPESNG
jgi:hypothetical protein